MQNHRLHTLQNILAELIGEDTARVAKFGVVVTADGSLFDTTYKAVGGGNTPGDGAADTDNTVLTVESSDNVVAPGTKNTDGLTFAVTGQPEVLDDTGRCDIAADRYVQTDR